MKLTFGKYKGEDLTDVPRDYLNWLDLQDWLTPELRKALIVEFARRANPGIGVKIKDGKV